MYGCMIAGWISGAKCAQGAHVEYIFQVVLLFLAQFIKIRYTYMEDYKISQYY